MADEPDEDLEALERAAYALHAGGEIDRAIVAYRAAIEARRAQLATLKFNLGTAFAASDRFDEAVEAYEGALRLRPGWVLALDNLGAVRRLQGSPALAERAYRDAIAIEPDEARLHYSLGLTLLEQGRAAEALAVAERAAALGPDDAAIHGLLGAALSRAGRPADAAAAYGRARDLAPERVEVHYNCALAAEAQDDLAGAIASYREALARHPRHVPSLVNLSRVLVDARRTTELAPVYAELLAADPGNTMVPHLLDGLEGRTTPRAPRAYVVDLFDGIAPRFEALLVGQLGYDAPGRIAAAAAAAGVAGGRALDLGCGTGLVGVALRDRVATLHGVDLAPRMIEEARAKGVYDALAVADAIDFLDADGERYDLIAAGDVLIYLGDLAPLVAAARRRLAPGGVLIATTEDGGDTDVRLQSTGRYAHGAAYVAGLAASHGLAIESRTAFPLRREAEGVIGGVLWVLRAPAGV